jgi:hypothetical protein
MQDFDACAVRVCVCVLCVGGAEAYASAHATSRLRCVLIRACEVYGSDSHPDSVCCVLVVLQEISRTKLLTATAEKALEGALSTFALCLTPASMAATAQASQAPPQPPAEAVISSNASVSDA